MEFKRIGIVGYGEVGKIFAAGLKGRADSVGAWDLKFALAESSAPEFAHRSMRELCDASDFIISAVTASNTLAVAQKAAPFIRAGTVFLDLNSASPGTKQQ